MNKSTRIAALVALIFVVACASQSFALGEISEITLTPDGRRLAIKSESRMGSYTEQMVPPSRLVIDITGTGVTQLPRISGLARDSSLNIRTAKTPSGARVVLDFGSQPVPDHKIVKMNNYLLVFLGQATGQEEAPPKPRVERSKPKETVPTAAPAHAPRVKRLPTGPAPNISDLSIQSAEIVDGLIVLKVSSKANPATVYRVDLGVDFQQMGFSTARIAPVQAIARSSVTGVEPAIATERRMGPRRLQTNLMAHSSGIEEEAVAASDEE
jgi:hypothetical protein